MARMSIDDGLGRDPRLDHLAELCGWSRREAAGCLQLDIWPLCYDRVTPNIPARDINIAANRGAVSVVLHVDGFAGALIEAGLARRSTKKDSNFEWSRKGKPTLVLAWKDREWRDRIYIKGAAERIAYLVTSQEAGRIGGRNSGKSRANQTKGPFEDPSRDPQGCANPSATPTAPDPVSVSPSAPGKQNQARERHPDAGAIATAAWNHAAKLQGELVLANVKAPTWPLMHGGQHAGWLALLERVSELLVGSTASQAEAVALNRVNVAAAVARRDGDGSYFTPLGMFTPNSFATWSGLDPTQIARKGQRNRKADLEQELADRPGPQPI